MITSNVKLSYHCYTSLPQLLGQKGGNLLETHQESLCQVQGQLKKAMTATVIMRTGEIDFDGFYVKYSLIDTGTDAVLHTDHRQVDPSSV